MEEDEHNGERKERKKDRQKEVLTQNRRQQMTCLQAVVNEKSLFTIRLLLTTLLTHLSPPMSWT
jgi:hypothetical protein